MPEAAGSSDLTHEDSRHKRALRAGFPWPGSPPSHLAPDPRRLVLVCLLCLLALALPATAGAKKTAKPHHASATPPPEPFGLAEVANVGDPVLKKEMTGLVREFYENVTLKTVARVRARKQHRRVDLLLEPGKGYRDSVRTDALSRLANSGADLTVSQYFVYADRNPATQVLFLALYDAETRTVRLLGADLFSSGKLRTGQDSFLTPVGVFENLPANWGYRALGTKNSKGWRGLGARGSRVWDFGWQQAPRKFRQGVRDSQMRLLMHATDPDHGEPRLGGPDSKGCVRVSAKANAFFDRHSILDRRYESLPSGEEQDLWLLRADRTPTRHPGSYLVVGDSAMFSASR